ncbi:hypothetical protein AMTR_s00006p00261060 [Amborella trichopoda]|uniref:Uncharacterized protein n=1 Tax=Amborella trichopoda TaxID=13333 RepID=W1PD01_AMBTC|nr:hypothetical protein AMTR_s00006p00261060 [Amborella trichopoda]
MNPSTAVALSPFLHQLSALNCARSIACECVRTRDLLTGLTLHAQLLRSPTAPPFLFVFNLHVSLYAKCGHLNQACICFNQIPWPNAFSLNAMLAAYVSEGLVHRARELFNETAQRDVVSWNTLIAGYARMGYESGALGLLSTMIDSNETVDGFTISGAISACSSERQGKIVHALGVCLGLTVYVSVSNALITMYSGCGLLDDGIQVFVEMRERDEISWKAMIVAYGQHRCGLEALGLFQEMVRVGVRLDMYTLASVLTCYSNLEDLNGGRHFHGVLIKSGFDSNGHVASGLIDMYSECGRRNDAYKIFDSIPCRDLVLWNTMIMGFALNERPEEAIGVFRELLRVGFEPDGCTLVCILSACSDLSLPLQGRQVHALVAQYEPHLSRHLVVGNALVSRACRICGNVELGAEAASQLVALEPHNAAGYVMLSNMHAEAGQWHEVAAIRKMMRDKGVKKVPGCSWIEVKNKLHVFVVEDSYHPMIDTIYQFLESISGKMRDLGYVPDVR